jgi:hypothetical protein
MEQWIIALGYAHLITRKLVPGGPNVKLRQAVKNLAFFFFALITLMPREWIKGNVDHQLAMLARAHTYRNA